VVIVRRQRTPKRTWVSNVSRNCVRKGNQQNLHVCEGTVEREIQRERERFRERERERERDSERERERERGEIGRDRLPRTRRGATTAEPRRNRHQTGKYPLVLLSYRPNLLNRFQNCTLLAGDYRVKRATSQSFTRMPGIERGVCGARNTQQPTSDSVSLHSLDHHDSLPSLWG